MLIVFAYVVRTQGNVCEVSGELDHPREHREDRGFPVPYEYRTLPHSGRLLRNHVNQCRQTTRRQGQ